MLISKIKIDIKNYLDTFYQMNTNMKPLKEITSSGFSLNKEVDAVSEKVMKNSPLSVNSNKNKNDDDNDLSPFDAENVDFDEEEDDLQYISDSLLSAVMEASGLNEVPNDEKNIVNCQVGSLANYELVEDHIE